VNRKALLTVLALAVVLLATPLVQAIPLEEKNNDKLQSYHDSGTFNYVAEQMGAVRTYIPSFDQVNKMVMEMDEVFVAYEIVVGGSKTYHMATDFAYEGHVAVTYYDPVFGDDAKTQVLESRAVDTKVDYMFDFSAIPGGLEGTLNMHAVFTRYGGISSLSGTGDLQNVQIQAANLEGSFTPPFYITVNHGGWVVGWP
jgi:hypothetical protein